MYTEVYKQHSIKVFVNLLAVIALTGMAPWSSLTLVRTGLSRKNVLREVINKTKILYLSFYTFPSLKLREKRVKRKEMEINCSARFRVHRKKKTLAWSFFHILITTTSIILVRHYHQQVLLYSYRILASQHCLGGFWTPAAPALTGQRDWSPLLLTAPMKHRQATSFLAHGDWPYDYIGMFIMRAWTLSNENPPYTNDQRLTT